MANNIELQQINLNTLGARVGQMLVDKGQTVAVAESSTGGLVSAALLAVPGASRYFRAGGVVYTREAWQALLGKSLKDIGGAKPLSEETATYLATTIREQLETDWGIGEIGATGPTGTRYGDPAGLCCIAIVGPSVERSITIRTGDDDRVANMWAFAQAIFTLFEEAL